jgi:hypothetical protein
MQGDVHLSLWYFMENGQPAGPLSTNQVIEKIKLGELGPNDLLYKNKALKWQEIKLIADFKSVIVVEPARASETLWVVLAKKSDGSGHRQKGPYPTTEIKNMLLRGDLKSTDYIWREGLKEWYKILSIPTFNESTSSSGLKQDNFPITHPLKDNVTIRSPKLNIVKPNADGDTALMDKNWAEITQKMKLPQELDNSQKTDRTQVLGNQEKFELTNASAENSDWASPEKSENDKEPKPTLESAGKSQGESDKVVRPGRIRREKSTADKSTLAERLNFWDWFLDLAPVKKSMILGGFVLTCFIIVFSLAFLTSKPKVEDMVLKAPKTKTLQASPNKNSLNDVVVKTDTEVAETENKNTALTEKNDDSGSNVNNAEITIENTAGNTTATANVIPSDQKPTYIKADILDPGGDGTQINIVSDAGTKYPVRVEIYSSAGKTLAMRSFQKSWVLSGSASRQISLTHRGVPYGFYQIEVFIDQLQAARTVNFGTRTKGFNEKLMEHNKQNVFAHNEERFQFVKLAGRIETQTWKLLQGANTVGELKNWKNFYKNWLKDFDRIKSQYLQRITLKNRNDYIHSKAWLELIAVRKKIAEQAKTLNVDINNKDKVTSKPIKDLAMRVQKLKDNMLQTTLF